MTKKYKISVIIPTYNNALTISRAIDSVLSQSFPPHEIIVVNDGSSDNTSDVLSKYEDEIIVVNLFRSEGPATARNAGLEIAKGNWIAFLDGDDKWLRRKLEKQVAFIESNPELKWCGTNYNIVKDDKTSSSIDKLTGELKGEYFSMMSKSYCSGSTITLLISRDVFDSVGRFTTGLIRNEDRDLYWRIAMSYPQYGFICEPLSVQYMGCDCSMRKRVEAKDGRYLRPVLDNNLNLAKEKHCQGRFVPFVSGILRNAMLTMIFLGLHEPLKDMLERYGRLLNPFWRLLIGICSRMKISSPISRGIFRMLKAIRLSGANRYLEYWQYIEANGFPEENGR